MNRKSMLLFLILLFLDVFVLSVRPSQAIPSFARKYNYICTVCHTMPPKLNKFGLTFMANGYQLDVQTEAADKLQKTEALSLLKDVPLSLRIIADAHYSFAEGQPQTDLHFPEGVILYSAGSLTDQLSFWVSGEPFLDEELDEIFIKFLVDYESPYLTVKLIKAGQFGMRDYFNFASGRNLTIDDYAIHQARVRNKSGDGNFFSLGAPQRTIELRGMFSGMTMWTIALSNGPGRKPGEFDNNTEKDYYLRLHKLFFGQYAIGGLGYWGTNELSLGRKNRFQRYIVDVDLDHERFDLTASILFGRDKGLEGISGISSSSVDHLGYFIEANYHLAQLWHGLTRYDVVDSDDLAQDTFPDLFAQTITLQLNYFHRLNLRFISEVGIDLS
ncbi:MAG: hypothetical protein ABGX83_07790 [Nitrospira sp.]|nr:hypothetical protein [Candidatus Manganitrophaceae bacterium]HIL35492.1 hypothetical protein [Candidatus Manganitrophaceae bacterium]